MAILITGLLLSAGCADVAPSHNKPQQDSSGFTYDERTSGHVGPIYDRFPDQP
jgi:hypothetical protein